METKNRLIKEILEDILESEEDDFREEGEGPNERHIYFKAYAVVYGRDSALKMLKETREQEGLDT